MTDEGWIRGNPGSAADLGILHQLETVGQHHFRSQLNDANFNGEIFGGQYLGQSLAAAMMTSEGYMPQMLSGFFLRSARADMPIDFIVERTRSGRRFAHRRVTVMQDNGEVFRAEVALRVPIEGQPEHRRKMPEVPGPEGLKSLRELAVERAGAIGPVALSRLTSKAGIDTYPIDQDTGLGIPARHPAGRYWVKGKSSIRDDILVDFSVLAYLSDVMANMASRAMHAANAYDDSLAALSLNHCLWLHARPGAQDWFLFDLESDHAGGGTGSNRGRIYSRDGTLIASVAQDALIQFAR